MRRMFRDTGVVFLVFLVLPALGELILGGGSGRFEDPPELSVGNPRALLSAYARWKVNAAGTRSDSELVIPLSYSKGLSSEFTQAHGLATLGLLDGSLHVVVQGLADPADHEIWLRDNREDGQDAVIRLGMLEKRGDAGVLRANLDANATLGFELDRVVVTRAGRSPEEASLLVGSPSLFQRLYFAEKRAASIPARYTAQAEVAEQRSPWLAPFALLVPAPAYAQDGGSIDLAALVAQGEHLFLKETFGGNGRTCGTCHPSGNNFTIDAAFMATLPDDDPLFIAEFDPALADLENPALMRQFGLIRANVDGFEDPTNKFVMRSVPHILGMAMTAQTGAGDAPFEATGWAGDGAPGGGRLRDFSVGAVTQHFPKTLARVPGQDFRLPTEHELDAMEAFMLSVGRQAEFDLKALRLTDSNAERGRALFVQEDSESHTVQAAKCNLCHSNGGALTVSGVNRSFETGVEDMLHPADLTGELRPRDGGFGTGPDAGTGGFGDGRFNVASLWEAADTAPFFHHNGAETLEEAIAFYDSATFKDSPEGQFILAFDTGGQEMAVEIDALAAFLRVLNTIENIRGATEFMARAESAASSAAKRGLLELALAELADAVGVLEEGELHPEVATLLGDSATSVAAAIAAAPPPSGCGQQNLAVANGLIGQAVVEAVVARDQMMELPLVQLPDPIPVPEPSSTDPNPDPDPEPAPGAVCTIYGCSATAPPDPPTPGVPPDPSRPPSSDSAEGGAIGIVAGKNLSAQVVFVDTPSGTLTLQITTATIFKGSVASNLSEVVTGHEIDVSFFLATNEVEQLETNFPENGF
jgi:cytochrome c peroxidase